MSAIICLHLLAVYLIFHFTKHMTTYEYMWVYIYVSIWMLKMCKWVSVCVHGILWHANTPNGHKLQECCHCWCTASPHPPVLLPRPNSLRSFTCVRANCQMAKWLYDRATQTSSRPTANAIYTCKTQPSTEEQRTKQQQPVCETKRWWGEVVVKAV